MVNSEIYTKISEEYEKLRMENAHKQRRRKNEVFEKHSDIEELFDKLSKIGVETARIVIDKKEKPKIAIEKLKREGIKINEEIKSKLKKYGYSEDYLENIYSCPICKDKGLVDDKKCKCFTQKFINYAYEMSRLGDTLKYENFDNFNLDFYTKEKGNEVFSPYEIMERNYKICKKFADDFEKKYTNVYMFGKTGLGKTFLCNSIAKEIIEKGKIVVYVTAFQLFNVIEKIKFNKSTTISDSKMIEMLYESDLLIIDDLGTEFRTSITDSELFNIINTRVMEKKQIVISSNLSMEELKKIYSERISSRIYDSFLILEFLGEDIRLKRKGL